MTPPGPQSLLDHRPALPSDVKATTPTQQGSGRLAKRKKEISFYSEQLGKQISGTYALSGRMVTVTAADGRQKSAPLGGSNPELLARLALIELEAKNSE